MEAYFMGIDTGTQGVRMGISDTRGKLVELVGSCQRNF